MKRVHVANLARTFSILCSTLIGVAYGSITYWVAFHLLPDADTFLTRIWMIASIPVLLGVTSLFMFVPLSRRASWYDWLVTIVFSTGLRYLSFVLPITVLFTVFFVLAIPAALLAQSLQLATGAAVYWALLCAVLLTSYKGEVIVGKAMRVILGSEAVPDGATPTRDTLRMNMYIAMIGATLIDYTMNFGAAEVAAEDPYSRISLAVLLTFVAWDACWVEFFRRPGGIDNPVKPSHDGRPSGQ